MKKVIITGATSGIGRGLALEMAKQGYIVGLVGRRTNRLTELKEIIGEQAFIKTLDITRFDEAEMVYHELIKEMGGLDIMILNAGAGMDKTLPPWQADEKTITLNVTAFAHGCHFAFGYFKNQGHGHIVGMSSLTCLLASHTGTAYIASKHFVSNYLKGFRQKVNRLDADIAITEIRPGYVKSEMTDGNKGMFWVSTPEKAAEQIASAIKKRKNYAYITRRWRLIGWAAKCVPEFVWDKI